MKRVELLDVKLLRNRELNNCSVIKFILILLVILCHSTAFWTGTWFNIKSPVYASPFLNCFTSFNSFHIYALTFVSGYIFFYKINEQKDYTKPKEFIYNKFKRLLIPYILTSLLWVIPINGYFYHYSLNDVLVKYVFGCSPSQLWYLLMLFNVFVIFFFLHNIYLPRYIKVSLIIIAYYFGSYIEIVYPNVFMLGTSLRYLIYFGIGYEIRGITKCRFYKVPIIFYTVVYLTFWYLLNSYEKNVGIIILPTLLFIKNIFGVFMVFFGLQKLLCGRQLVNNHFIKLLVSNSFTMYLVHQQIIYLIIILTDGLVNPIANSIIVFVICLFSSFLLSIILKKIKLYKI